MATVTVNGTQRQDSALVVCARDLVKALKPYEKENVTFYGVTIGARRFLEYLRLWKAERLVFLPVKESMTYPETVWERVTDRPRIELRETGPTVFLSISNGNGHKTRIRDGAWLREGKGTVSVLVGA